MQQTDTFNKKKEPMKKVFQLMLLCAVMLTGFSSCQREVMYTVTNQTGARVELFIYEYNEANESINSRNLAFVDNESRVFTAAKDAVKIKLYVPIIDAWVNQVFYLEENLEATIMGSTIMTTEEP